MGAQEASGSSLVEVASIPRGPGRFVDAAYRDLLGRSSEPAGREFWVGRLASGVTRTWVTFQMAHGSEWTRRVVRQKFVEVVGREPSSAELAAWLDPLRQRRTRVADLVAFLYGSSTFYAQVGGSGGAWVDAAFQRLLFRAPTATERTAALGRIAGGNRRAEALRMVLSVEANGYRVDDLYRLLLGRAAEPGGREFWAGRLVNGDDLRLAAQLAGSNEYEATSQTRIVEGTIEKPATTAIAAPGQVRDLVDGDPADPPVVGDTAIAVLDAAAVAPGATHVSIPVSPESPDGFMGAVTSRVVSGASVTVGLRRTPLEEVFPSADFSGTIDLPQPVDGGTVAASSTGDSPRPMRSACSGSGNSFKFNAKAGVRVEVVGKWSPAGEKKLRFVATGSIGGSVDILLGASFSCELPARGWTIPFAIGPVPFTADVKPLLRIDGEIGARITGSISYGCTVGAEWRNGQVQNLTGCGPVRWSV
ncbi:DUF4214 domain-containing protein [Iamia sp. SCSIO 61187]|uniref:DUF4214 domain-containing protein n=1 Tax=Iamia sp. SCSIO 61187 TaxID=2722752 RepID=UPI001C62A612|nr:DUF4214 domain-containing protein [Iamia sp. SCSIO 61187]QYG93450.1 DUF4214 domain-containing protein [Iamia sp. SCSIO 61187]